MIIYTIGQNSWGQFIVVLFAFIFVIIMAYLSTRIIASINQNRVMQGNIEAIETYRITPNKYLQIVRVVDRYMVISVCKDTISFIIELSEDDIKNLKVKQGNNQSINFKEIFDKVKNAAEKNNKSV